MMSPVGRAAGYGDNPISGRIHFMGRAGRHHKDRRCGLAGTGGGVEFARDGVEACDADCASYRSSLRSTGPCSSAPPVCALTGRLQSGPAATKP